MKKYIASFLAVFVFVTGLMVSGSVSAESLEEMNEKLSKDIAKDFTKDLFSDSSEFVIKVDGAQDFKVFKKDTNDEYYTGTVFIGERIRIHGIINTVPLIQYSNGKYSSRSLSGDVQLTSKNGNKIVKRIQKSYSNTKDNYLDYVVPDGITQIDIVFHLIDKLKGKVKENVYTHQEEAKKPIYLTVVPKQSALISDAAKKEAASVAGAVKKNDGNDKKDNDKVSKKEDKDSGGIGTAGKVIGGISLAGIVGWLIVGHTSGGVTGGGLGSGGSQTNSENTGRKENGSADDAIDEETPPDIQDEGLVYTDPETGKEVTFQKDPETGQWVDPETGNVFVEETVTVPPQSDWATYIHKDPVNGFENMYIKDPTDGQWYNYEDYNEGYRVPVDMNGFKEYDAQRLKDGAWNREQMQKLENRETQLDKELKEEYEQMLEREREIQRQTEIDIRSIGTGTYGMTPEERLEVLKARQEGLQEAADQAARRADQWDTVVKTAEVVQTAADMGVDALATITAPVGGGLIADAYAITKNVAGSTMEGMVTPGRTVLGGIAEGITKGTIDVAQNHTGGKWGKMLTSYVGGESIKGGIDAGIKGESIVKGMFKGAGKGATKVITDKVAEGIGNKITKNSENSLRNAYNHHREIREIYSKDISQKSVDALQKMNVQKHLANVQKANYQTVANTITNAVTRNTLPNMIFGE